MNEYSYPYYWDGTKWAYYNNQLTTYPIYTWVYPDTNQQVISQLLKRIADLEAKLEAKQ